jgi:starch synthase
MLFCESIFFGYRVIMNEKMKILIAASEAVPFIKTGGLADVAGVLPRYLEQLGFDSCLVLPRYALIDPDVFSLERLPGVLTVPMGVLGQQFAAVYRGAIPGCSAPVYFIEHEGYFGRSGLYEEDGEGYPDNGERFVFFSKACLELGKMTGFRPDVIHLHDWHTAAIAPLLNTAYRFDPLVGEAASVLTLHNLQHQGWAPKDLMEVLGIGWAHFNYLELEMYDQVNLLKGGIYHATQLCTVSEGYAREIQTPAYGEGLDEVLRDCNWKLHGILNGVDYDEWNPETDPLLAARYSVDDLSGKAVCKKDLQQVFGLPQRDDVPLFGLVSRLVKQKGIDILAAAIDRILALDLQMVLVGNGEPWAHFFFGDVAAAHPDKFACFIGYDNARAHKVEAGADFFLMPSRFEPCGLNQMYSLRYGTPPIVRATGGLDDSVENYDVRTRTGTGFKFLDPTPEALYDTVGWAVHTWYNDREGLDSLIRNGMTRRFSWEAAAHKYGRLYRRAAEWGR